MRDSPLENRWLFRYLLVSITILAGLVIPHLDLAQYFSTRIIGGVAGDPGLYVWLARSFERDPLRALAFESESFYPYPLSRAWSDNFLLPSAIIWGLKGFGIPFEARYNLLLVATILLSGISTYALARSLSAATIPSLVAGMLFMNSSYLLGNIGHTQLMFVFWVPLAMALVIRGPNRAASWFCAGLCICGAFYSAVYYAIFLVLALGTIAVFHLLRGPFLPRGRNLLRCGIACSIAASPVLWAVRPYLEIREAFGARHLFEASYFAASGIGYLAYSALNSSFGATAAWTHGEATLCPGYSLLAFLAAITIGVSIRTRSVPSFIALGSTLALGISSSLNDSGNAAEYTVILSSWILLASAWCSALRMDERRGALLAVGALFFVLSFGPGGNPAKSEPAMAPFAIFFQFVPGADSIRAVARFGVVAMIVAYVGIAIAFSDLYRRKSIRAGALLLVFALINGIENYHRHLPVEAIHPAPRIFATASAAARAVPGGAIILPFAGALENREIRSWTEFATLNTQASLWAVDYNLTVVNGYSGQRSKLQDSLPNALESFPSARSVEALSHICGLRYVIAVPELMSNEARQSLAAARDLPSGLIRRGADESGNQLFELTGPVPSNAAEPFFAPRGCSIGVSASPGPCDVRVSEWRIGEKSTIEKVEITSIQGTLDDLSTSFTGSGKTSGRPVVFSIETPGCTREVSCRSSCFAD